MAHRELLPNFFIVGAPKAGTTSLYAYLGQHPQIYVSPVKEPSYFAPEQCHGKFGFSANAYLDLFRGVTTQVAIGEATATYLFSATAARNIAARLPHARIIISLRDPAERAYSQYLQMRSLGLTRRSFREQLETSLRQAGTEFGPLWPFLELGRYPAQIGRYFEVFPRSQIHICYHEDLASAPQRLMQQLYAFLDVDPRFVPDITQRHNEPRIPRLESTAYLLKKWGWWRPLRKLLPGSPPARLQTLLLRPRASLRMQSADRAFLVDYYRDDVRQLARLLGRDFDSWLDGPGPSVEARLERP